MIVQKLSLAEYFDLIVERATFEKYKWVIMFIARKADAEYLYAEIEQRWWSFHDLTNDRIAFVFSSGLTINDNSFYRLPNHEIYEGRMCPFAQIVGEDKFKDNFGNFGNCYHKFPQIDWEDAHTQSITEFIRKNKIKEYDLPGAFIYNVFSKRKEFVHLNGKSSLYSFLKEFVCQTEKLDSELEQAHQTIREDRNIIFFELEEEIIAFAERQKIEYRNAIKEVLKGNWDYKSSKEIITDKYIRKQIKKYIQWKRQLSITNDNYDRKKEDYYNAKKNYRDCDNKISDYMTMCAGEGEVVLKTMNKNATLHNIVFVFIADEWDFSNGGINVFNRLLCEVMGALKREKIICLTRHVTEEKAIDAKMKGIELLNVSETDFENENVIVNILNANINMEGHKVVFVGHDVKTGEIALKCKALLNNSKCAIIHHMAYAEYYPILNNDFDVSEAKEDLQRKILQQADVIFANGTGLEKSAQDIVGDKVPIVKIYPGVSNVEVRKTINNSFKVVTFGRIEREIGKKKDNSIIKETYLALAAWIDFVNKYCKGDETIMKIYGKNADDNSGDKEMENLLKECSEKVYVVSCVKYENDRDVLLSKLSELSLCLVLSLREGFGLTALEAISAGIPVILSKSSGFYKSLEELRLDSYVYGVEIQGKYDYPYYSAQDLENVSKTIYKVYKNQRDAKKKAIELKRQLEENGFTWKNCADSIINFFADNE